MIFSLKQINHRCYVLMIFSWTYFWHQKFSKFFGYFFNFQIYFSKFGLVWGPEKKIFFKWVLVVLKKGFWLLKIVFEKLLILRICFRPERNYPCLSSSKNISITIGHSRSVFSYPLDTVCLWQLLIFEILQGVSYWNVLFELALRVRRTNNVFELLCLVASGGVDIWVSYTSL